MSYMLSAIERSSPHSIRETTPQYSLDIEIHATLANPTNSSTYCFRFKGELKPEISLLHMKVLTLIKAKSNVFLDMCNAVAAREDRKPKY